MYFDKTIKFIYDSVFDGEVRVIHYQYRYLTYNYYYHMSLLAWISYFDFRLFAVIVFSHVYVII